jgi:hypothetical protein
LAYVEERENGAAGSRTGDGHEDVAAEVEVKVLL